MNSFFFKGILWTLTKTVLRLSVVVYLGDLVISDLKLIFQSFLRLHFNWNLKFSGCKILLKWNDLKNYEFEIYSIANSLNHSRIKVKVLESIIII